MKTILTIILLTGVLFYSNYLHAQKESKKFSFGFGLEAGVVSGDFKDVYGASTGITLRASYKAGPGFATFTSGGIAFLPKSFEGEDLKAGLQIPVKVGYKYLFNKHLFAMAEVGLSSFKYYYEGANGEVENTSQSGFSYAPTLGFQMGTFELGLRYEATSLTGASLSAGLLRLGFNF